MVINYKDLFILNVACFPPQESAWNHWILQNQRCLSESAGERSEGKLPSVTSSPSHTHTHPKQPLGLEPDPPPWRRTRGVQITNWRPRELVLERGQWVLERKATPSRGHPLSSQLPVWRLQALSRKHSSEENGDSGTNSCIQNSALQKVPTPLWTGSQIRTCSALGLGPQTPEIPWMEVCFIPPSSATRMRSLVNAHFSPQPTPVSRKKNLPLLPHPFNYVVHYMLNSFILHLFSTLPPNIWRWIFEQQ